MIKEFTFPANNCSPGFTISVDTRAYCLDTHVISLELSEDSLYIWHRLPYPYNPDQPLHRNLVLGWRRARFPECCGLDIVSSLNSAFLLGRWGADVSDKWWTWARGVAPMLPPAIGVVVLYQNPQNEITLAPEYEWYADRGTPYGPQFKNIRYPNHVLQSYLFFPHKGIEQVVNPKFGMLTA